MSSVVFEVDFEPDTIAAIGDLRRVRRDVLKTQITEIHETLNSLISMGALREDERLVYEQRIIEDLGAKLSILEERIKLESK